LLVHPARLVIDPGIDTKWRSLTRGRAAQRFRREQPSVVAQTSAAWLERLASALPQMHADTVEPPN
jgi:hypothetical protein